MTECVQTLWATKNSITCSGVMLPILIQGNWQKKHESKINAVYMRAQNIIAELTLKEDKLPNSVL